MPDGENRNVVRNMIGKVEAVDRVRQLVLRYGGTEQEFIKKLLIEAGDLIKAGEMPALTFEGYRVKPEKCSDDYKPLRPNAEMSGALNDEFARLAANHYKVSINVLLGSLVAFMLDRRKQEGERTLSEESQERQERTRLNQPIVPLLAAELQKASGPISFKLDRDGNLIPQTKGAKSLLAAISYELLQPKSPLITEMVLASIGAAAREDGRHTWIEDKPKRTYFIARRSPRAPKT